MRPPRVRAAVITLVILLCLAVAVWYFMLSGIALPEETRFPYGSSDLDGFIGDSFKEAKAGKAEAFHAWATDAHSAWRDKSVRKGAFPFPGAEGKSLREFLDWGRLRVHSSLGASARAAEELRLAAGVHRMVKEMIPRFCLQRGYEFASVVRHGERQCFLQSVIIAAFLQSMGMPAGVVMIYRNEKGKESINGHAAVMLKLEDGRDVIVDASSARPFARHLGCFCSWKGGYRYVSPLYEKQDNLITGYKAGVMSVPARELMPLDRAFMRSQFDCYRGEWAQGGLRSPMRLQSRAGMERACSYFIKSLRSCPDNPLSFYLLARCFEEIGEKQKANRCFAEAQALFSRCGWVPSELRAKLRH